MRKTCPFFGGTRYDPDIERRVITDPVESGVSGIAVTPVGNDAGRSNPELFRTPENRNISVVFLDIDLGATDFDAVVQHGTHPHR